MEVSSDAAKVILNVADRAFVERSSTAAPFILIPTNHEQLRAVSTERWKSAWQRRLAPAVLVLADLSLALLVWEISYLLQGVWGTSPLSVNVAVAAMAPTFATATPPPPPTAALASPRSQSSAGRRLTAAAREPRADRHVRQERA